jgi:hypothetical protein
MRLLFLLTLACLPLVGQSDFRKHNITGGLGTASPRQDLDPYFRTRPALSIGYGYRFFRYAQVDAGLDMVFGAASVREFVDTGFLGPRRIRDRQFLVPLGGRVILPIGRVLVYGGGGGAFMRYSEMVNQPNQWYRIDCPICRARDGWASYALVGGSIALDDAQHFRIGGTAKMYRGFTEGQAFGAVPNIRTNDGWLNIMGEFTFSF